MVFKEILEAYCDDINVMTNSLDDIERLSNIVVTFEKFSGAILSRNLKCKILGLGKWNRKVDWPVQWLKPVDSIKVFGVFISNSYRQMISENWNYRFDKFRNVIMSWSSRTFVTLKQKVEVIRMFALSRIYYVASILPIRTSIVKKMEALIGKFIWAGYGILRIALEDLKMDESSGGLGVPCITNMNKALMSSQCIRLLNSGDKKSVAHLDLWLGQLLSNIVPEMGSNSLLLDTPEYFSFLRDCLATLMVEDVLTTASIKELTNRKIYRSLISLASVKVTRDNPGINYSLVWKRLQSSVIPYEYRDSLLLLVHNKLPVPERMNRLGLIDTPLCQYCNGNDETADIVHFFCSCVRTRRVWSWLRVKLISLSSSLQHDTNWTLLNLAFTAKASENEVVWLLIGGDDKMKNVSDSSLHWGMVSII